MLPVPLFVSVSSLVNLFECCDEHLVLFPSAFRTFCRDVLLGRCQVQTLHSAWAPHVLCKCDVVGVRVPVVCSAQRRALRFVAAHH
jgi:hypothetical protein